MVTKTALLVGAFKVAVLAGCAGDVQQQRRSNVAIEQTKERRDACYADAALSIDDGVSDARTVGQAVSARCQTHRRADSSDLVRRPKGRQLSTQEADEMATTYVIEFRRLKKLPA